MFALSPADVLATESRRQDLLASAATARQLASRDAGTSRPVLAGVLRGIGAALGHAAALVPDGREGIRSKEQDLATLGVRWATDSADDVVLARELQAARAQRQARRPVSPAGGLLEGRPVGRRAYVPRMRRALAAAFAR